MKVKKDQGRVEFDAMVIVNNKPKYERRQGDFQEWRRHPQNSSVIAIVRDDLGKIHLKNPEDIVFLG